MKFHYDSKQGCMVDPDGNPMVTDSDKWEPVAPFVFTGFAEFRSPIDGTLITNNWQLREHEKIHGVVQIGTDIDPYKQMDEIIEKQEKERSSYAPELTGWSDPD